MRSLTISLLVVVLVAIFVIGWTLDALFFRYSEGIQDNVSVVVSFAGDMADTLNNMTEPSSFVDQWNKAEFAKASLSELRDYSIPPEIADKLIGGEALLLESDRGMSASFYLPAHDLVFAVEDIRNASDSGAWVKAVFTSLFYLSTLAVVFIWLKPLLLRLHRLKKAAGEFGEGDLNSRVNTGGLSYIKDIENQFNGMADQIQTLIEDNKLLTSGVSHDLRTPLARLRFGVDTLAATKDKIQRRKYERRISADLDEMESLVDSLLRFARLDNVMEGVEKTAVELPVLIQECVSQYLDEPIQIVTVPEKYSDSEYESLVIYGSYVHLATMVNNLLQNAVNYAETQVLIELHVNNGNPGFSISDDGPGIAESQRSKVLKPFQRGDGATGAGYGLGLAVAARIADRHKAQLVISNNTKLGGTKFSLSFESSTR